MGINGLLGVLRSVTKKAHVKEFKGQRVAIDAYSWLHKGTYGCATELCLTGDSNKYIEYCLTRARLLIQHNVEPVFVFDGGPLPMKALTEDARRAKREKAKREALILHRSGNPLAHKSFSSAIDVSHSMAFKLILELRKHKIQYVVAPYEADAQLAYLSSPNAKGKVDFVISEDSDCVAFGCNVVFFKMDAKGNGEVFRQAELRNCTEINVRHFTKDMILQMCILAGCDYLSSLPGLGIRKAHQFVSRYKTTEKILRGVKFAGFSVSKEYEKQFFSAINTFRHQRVFDKLANEEGVSMVELTPFESALKDTQERELDFLGPKINSDNLCFKLCNGEVDPLTRKKTVLPTKTSKQNTPLPGGQQTLDLVKKGVKSMIKASSNAQTQVSKRGVSTGIKDKTDLCSYPTSRSTNKSILFESKRKRSGSSGLNKFERFFSSQTMQQFKRPRHNTENVNASNIVSKHFSTDATTTQDATGATGNGAEAKGKNPEVESEYGGEEEEEGNSNASETQYTDNSRGIFADMQYNARKQNAHLRTQQDTSEDLYHSDLVSPAFRPLPISSISQQYSIVSPKQNREYTKHAIQYDESQETQHNTTVEENGGFFQSYKFSANSFNFYNQ